LQPNAGAGAQLYTRIFVYGSSSDIATTTIDAEWQRFTAGIAGNGTFTPLGFESNDDEDTPAYQPLGDSVSVWGNYLALGGLCQSCTSKHFAGFLNDLHGSQYPSPFIPVGVTRDSIGVRLTVNGAFSNFRWTLVKARPFEVVVRGSRFSIGTPISIVAMPFGPAPAGTRYVWDFGDGTAPVTVVDDSTVSHVFQHLGRVVIKAVLRDASGRKLAVASDDLDLEGPVWRIDSVGISQAGPAFQGESEADTAYHAAVAATMSALLASPGDNLIIARPAGALWQQVAAGQGSSVTGFLDDAALCGLGQEGTGVISLPCHYFIAAPPNYALGTVGSGTLTGQYSISSPGDPYYAGFLNTITASMTPGFLRGQMTIASFGGGSGPTFTIRFRAVQVP
ncbi:MAG TPA: PKD domain-containing protein, partial [Gemmatimonadales bacterium]|nr:PKD domain-containing protein [Gemmatimonadales bacterium]